jgi:hypothetical protein
MKRLATVGALAISSVFALSAQDPTLAIGGAGPAPYFENALDKIADALKSSGVKVKILSGDARTRTALLDETKHRGYASLLYVTLESPRDNKSDAARGDIAGACFVDGKQVWTEDSKSPLVLPLGFDHEVDSMVNGIVKKISKRAGGPCLPKVVR